METPWGPSQSETEIAPGIVFYSTAGHGGFHLSDERLAEMPKAFREFSTWAGPGWFEEDCDANLVIAAFPQHFSEEAGKQARAMLKAWKPELYEQWISEIAGTTPSKEGRAR